MSDVYQCSCSLQVICPAPSDTSCLVHEFFTLETRALKSEYPEAAQFAEIDFLLRRMKV